VVFTHVTFTPFRRPYLPIACARRLPTCIALKQEDVGSNNRKGTVNESSMYSRGTGSCLSFKAINSAKTSVEILVFRFDP